MEPAHASASLRRRVLRFDPCCRLALVRPERKELVRRRRTGAAMESDFRDVALAGARQQCSLQEKRPLGGGAGVTRPNDNLCP